MLKNIGSVSTDLVRTGTLTSTKKEELHELSSAFSPLAPANQSNYRGLS